MAGIEPTMLWEATDAAAALRGRFRFGSAAEVEAWLPILMRWHGLDLARK